VIAPYLERTGLASPRVEVKAATFLDEAHPAHVGKGRPVGADTAAIFIGLSDVVSADRNQPAIGDLELAVELDEPFGLPAVLGAR
jgi:hypothetical protein